MKKIWLWLLLLLLLIILCVWTKKDSIHVSSNTQGVNAVASVPKTASKHVNYSIKQTGKTYMLSGNFTDKAQVNSLSDTCTAAKTTLISTNANIDTSLIGEDAISLTNKILPHFIANYSNGEISYKDQTLIVSGDVEGYAPKDTMQTLLNTSTLASTDNTKVLLVEPINFNIKKLPKQLQLSGTFTNKKQIRKISKHLRPTYSTVNVRKNAHRIDKGAIALTEKILPTFVKNYTSGEITYMYETLIVKGTAKNQDALNKMNSFLKHANIPVENLSTLDPNVIKKMQAEKEATLAKERAKKEALLAIKRASIAKEEAMKEAALAKEEAAQKLAQAAATKESERKSALTAELLAKQKTEQEAMRAKTKAKQAEQKVKENIAKLLKIENIEFEVAKGTLTQKGQATVDKLANILKQYPNIRIEIAGHTDSDGSAQFNQRLSQDRVDTVRKRLITKGIPSKQLTAKGYGESKPLVPNTSDANKAKNRRVEINTQGN